MPQQVGFFVQVRVEVLGPGYAVVQQQVLGFVVVQDGGGHFGFKIAADADAAAAQLVQGGVGRGVEGEGKRGAGRNEFVNFALVQRQTGGTVKGILVVIIACGVALLQHIIRVKHVFYRKIPECHQHQHRQHAYENTPVFEPYLLQKYVGKQNGRHEQDEIVIVKTVLLAEKHKGSGKTTQQQQR